MKYRFYTLVFLLVLCFGLNTQAQTKTSLLVAVTPGKTLNNHAKWKRSATINAHGERGELYIFQLGIWAKNKTLKNVRIIPNDNFVSKIKAGIISKSSFVYATSEKALDTASITPQTFTVEKNARKIIYCAVHIPVYISPTTFSGKLNIEIDGVTTKSIGLNINVLHFKARKQDVSKDE